MKRAIDTTVENGRVIARFEYRPGTIATFYEDAEESDVLLYAVEENGLDILPLLSDSDIERIVYEAFEFCENEEV